MNENIKYKGDVVMSKKNEELKVENEQLTMNNEIF